MTNPTKPALNLNALEADVHNHVLSMNGARDIGFGLKIDEVLALIEAVRERDTLRAQLTQAREALEVLSRLGNEPYLWNSDGDRIAQVGLAAITLAALIASSTEDKS